jgi:hypothetical protein
MKNAINATMGLLVVLALTQAASARGGSQEAVSAMVEAITLLATGGASLEASPARLIVAALM